MSMRCLLLAVRDHLRGTSSGGMGLLPTQCEICLDGQPPADCPEFFVGIHPGPWGAIDIEGLYEQFSIQVTVSVREPKMPDDRLWRLMVLSADPADTAGKRSLYGLCESIRAALHLDVGGDRILNLMNSYLGASVNGLVEPLRFQSGGTPMRKGPDWFSSDDEATLCGLAQTMSFSSAGRVQTIESMS